VSAVENLVMRRSCSIGRRLNQLDCARARGRREERTLEFLATIPEDRGILLDFVDSLRENFASDSLVVVATVYFGTTAEELEVSFVPVREPEGRKFLLLLLLFFGQRFR
jgi:hypothetical protein